MAVLILAGRYRIFIRTLTLLCLCSCLALTTFGKAHADEKSLQLYEQKIKAGIVYNLLKYTDWPEEAALNNQGKLHICLYGADPFDGYLAPLEGRTAQQIPIAISHLQNIAETEQCSVVIIHRNQTRSLPELLTYLSNKNILTISDIEHFAASGGMIELAKEGEKISLYINTNAISNARLSIKGPMLKLAKIVSS